MPAQTFSPRAVAKAASVIMRRPVTDKQVRGLARDIIARFDKTKHPAYQSHEYSAAEQRTLLDVFRQRAGAGRSSRSGQRKATTARKAARTRKAAAQTQDAPDGA